MFESNLLSEEFQSINEGHRQADNRRTAVLTLFMFLSARKIKGMMMKIAVIEK